jgi:replicative DNA helicase
MLVSIEMPRAQIVHRLLADLAYGAGVQHDGDVPLPFTRFRSGKLSDTQFGHAFDASQRLKELTTLEIFDGDGVSIHEISALAERFAARFNTLGVVCIDYLQIVRPSDRYKGAKVQEITEISNALKALAKRIGWPVVVGCQLNRGVEGREVKRPRLGDLRESGAIEQDADLVLGLYRPGYYLEEKRPEHGEYDENWTAWKTKWDAEKNDLEILVQKNRNGPTGIARVHVEVAASAIRNRPDDVQAVEYPEGYAGR